MDSSRLGVCARIFSAVLVTGVLAACQDVRQTPPPPDYGALIESADGFVAAGQVESALSSFNEAARADPTRKTPWLRIAQLQFDQGNYGSAVVASQEVLQRDPDDEVADSILVVSSLRIAVDTLSRMRGGESLSGVARSEAERLAASMREKLGEDILVPQLARPAQPARPAQRAAPRPAPTPQPSPQPSSGGTGNPFSVLEDRGGN